MKHPVHRCFRRRFRSCLHFVLLACLAVESALGGGGAFLDRPFEDLLDVTIESASGRPEQIRDIPASVTIITRQEIARYGYVTFEELIKNVPGLFLLDNTGERFSGSRGNVGGGILYLVNGVQQHPSAQKELPMPKIAYLNIPVESIDRIEVVRGPMSVIYGNNAFLGVVNVVTNAVNPDGSRLSVSVGERNSGRVFVRAERAFDDGFVIFNAGAYQTDGLEAVYADMMNADQRATLVPGMHSGLDGLVDQHDLSLQLSMALGNWSADLRYTQNEYGFYILKPGFEDGNRARVSAWHATIGWNYPFSDRLGVSVDSTLSEERADAYQFDFLSPEVGGEQLLKSRRWDLEARAFWDASPDVHLVAGYRFRLMGGIENSVDVPPVVTVRNRIDSFVTHDVFSELAWSASEQLRMTGGMRLSRLPESYTLNGDDYPVSDRNLVTGRVAALWSFDENRVVKLIWGTAAKDNDQIEFTEPERIETTEVVFVQTSPAWTFSASLFHNEISRVVRRTQVLDKNTGDYTPVIDNSGEWSSDGLEVIGELRPIPALTLNASVTWQNTDDRKSGLEPAYSPHLLAKIKADYQRGPVTYAVYGHYVGSMEADWDFVDGPTAGVTERIGDPVAGYWNLGLNLRYAPPGSGLFANLNVSNLLDEEIRYPANDLADFGRGLIGPGRIVTATVGYQF